MPRKQPDRPADVKLARDRIPELIEAEGRLANWRTASPTEYQGFLRDKLREEVEEFLTASKPEELADILEVVFALGAALGLSEDDLAAIRSMKASESGRFDERIVLHRCDTRSLPDLIAAVEELRTGGSPNRPYRHQAITLLWAIGRARQRLDRLVPWSHARLILQELLTTLGLPESKPTPEYPFLALRSSGLWEIAFEPQHEIPRAHGSTPKSWLNDNDPSAGLRIDVWTLVANDTAAATAMVNAIASRFFCSADYPKLCNVANIDGQSTLPSS